MKKQKSIVYGPRCDDGTRWIENASHGLRIVGDAHDLARIGHTGWFLDPLGDGETVHGAVLQLPAQDGEAIFLPAVADPYNDDCYSVDFGDWYKATRDDVEQAKRDCARAADSLAEAYAENEREYQTKETARMKIEEARERIKETRAAHTVAVRELRSVRALGTQAPTLCSMLRTSLARMRDDVGEARREIRELTANPYYWLERAYR